MSELDDFIHNQFRRGPLERCASEITTALENMSKQHPPMAIIAALGDWVGFRLYLAQKDQTVSEKEARATLERIKALAFASTASVPVHPWEEP